jgi:hypothetical protein
MTRALVLAFGAAFLLTSAVAWAKPKVALTPIEGDASGDIRDAVAEALEGDELALIGSREVNRAVDKLGDVADLTEKDFRKLAVDLEADAIVLGKLDRNGNARTLKFKLYIRKKMARGFTVSFKDAKSEKFRSMLHDKMVDKIGTSPAGDAEEDRARPKKAAEDEDDPLAAKGQKKDRKFVKKSRVAEEEEEARPTRKAKLADEEDEARPTRKARLAEDEAEDEAEERSARKKLADDEAAPDEEAEPGDDDEPRKARKKVAAAEDDDELEAGVTARSDGREPRRTANHAAIRLDLGVSMQQRSLTFATRDVPNKPKGAEMSPVPGGRIQAEIYPLALSGSRGALANVGIGAEYDRTLSLNIQNSLEPMTKVPVKQSHYSLGLRYRMAFGQSATSPTLTFGVGYGKRLFSPDRSALTMIEARGELIRDTPSTHYTVIDPGVAFRFPVTRMVALAAGGRGMIITKVGSIQNPESYGRAKVYGADAFAAVDVVLGNRFALRFAGEFAQVGFTFEGTGELSNFLDEDRTTKEVGGLTDRSIGGSATLAVMY